jgi:hypothetical protein
LHLDECFWAYSAVSRRSRRTLCASRYDADLPTVLHSRDLTHWSERKYCHHHTHLGATFLANCTAQMWTLLWVALLILLVGDFFTEAHAM